MKTVNQPVRKKDAMQHIQNTLADGWKKKDVFDLSLYAVD